MIHIIQNSFHDIENIFCCFFPPSLKTKDEFKNEKYQEEMRIPQKEDDLKMKTTSEKNSPPKNQESKNQTLLRVPHPMAGHLIHFPGTGGLDSQAADSAWYRYNSQDDDFERSVVMTS